MIGSLRFCVVGLTRWSEENKKVKIGLNDKITSFKSLCR